MEILESKLQRVDKARASEASLPVWLPLLLVLSSNFSNRKQPEPMRQVCLFLHVCTAAAVSHAAYLMTAQRRRAWQHTGCSLLSDGQQSSDHLPSLAC